MTAGPGRRSHGAPALVLLVDDREQKGVLAHLQRFGARLQVETRRLPVGDYCWVLRLPCGRGGSGGCQSRRGACTCGEVMLQYVVERKTASDLTTSMRAAAQSKGEDRYNRQKWLMLVRVRAMPSLSEPGAATCVTRFAKRDESGGGATGRALECERCSVCWRAGVAPEALREGWRPPMTDHQPAHAV